MTRCLMTTPEGEVREGDLSLIDAWKRLEGAHIWVDMQGESEASSTGKAPSPAVPSSGPVSEE